jgi:hypothetical protein
MAADMTTYNQLAQANAPDLQQPRNDLQPTSDTTQQGTDTGPAPTGLSQDQLSDKQLRVGDSPTTVQNTTTAGPYTSEPVSATMWVWLALLIVGAVVLLALVLRKRPSAKDEAELADAVAEAVVPSKNTKSKAAKKKASAARSRSPAKRKTRR